MSLSIKTRVVSLVILISVILTSLLAGPLFAWQNALAQAGAPDPGRGTPQETFQLFLPVAAESMQGGVLPPSSYQMVAYSDATVLLPQNMLEQLMPAQKAKHCPPPAHSYQPMSAEQALANAWAYIEARIGASTLASWRLRPEVSTAEKAQAFAMAAMADRRPDGALAALLMAYEHDPASKLVLVNAAGMLASLGMPNEALAFLDAAAALPGDYGNPLGIPGEQLAENNRAFALLELGQYSQAEAVLLPLVEVNTQLAEARSNLSKALLCQDKNQGAARFYRLGERRMLWDAVIDGPETEGMRIPVEHILDRSAGKLFELPNVYILGNPQGAGAASSHYDDLFDQQIARERTRQALIEANSAARNARPLPGPLTFSRFANVMITAMRSEYEPDVQALYEQAVAIDNQMLGLEDQQDIEFGELFELYPDVEAFKAACQSTVTSHLSQWLQVYYEFEDALAAYAQAKYAAMTGVASNLADDLNHEYVSLLIEDSIELEIEWQITTLWRGASTTYVHWEACQAALPPEPAGVSADPIFEWSLACPPSTNAGKFQVTLLDVLAIKANCEQLEVELAGTAGLTPFAQVTVDFKNKKTTIFAGAKIQSPPGMIKAAAQEGFFISVGERGISDGGIKISTSGDLGGEVLAGTIDGPGFEFGVAAAVDYLTTGGAPSP